MHMIYKDAGMRIGRLRKLRGMSRKDLSKKCKVTEKFIYEIEAGKKGFSAATLYDIANTLEVCSDYILSGTKPEWCSQKQAADIRLSEVEDSGDVSDLL